jgi:hypothetical protein
MRFWSPGRKAGTMRRAFLERWELLNADGCLYLYDIDDCCE